MDPVIYIQPEESWKYFFRNKSRLSKELVEIAANEALKTSVYMTEEDEKPYLYVYREDKKVFQSACATIYDTERILKVVYTQYLYDIPVVKDSESDVEDNLPDKGLDEMTESEFQDYIDEREDVILAAASAMIEVLIEDDICSLEHGENKITLDDMVNHIVEYLAIDCGLLIRRPMVVIENGSGKEVRTEYPYEEYDFGKEELH